ncbi:inositol monophosphatase [candidate division KSB1 bacterium]|nr:inositol monophosphatase [candidate division KSB1 bacterium]
MASNLISLNELLAAAIRAAQIGGENLQTHLSRVKYYEISKKAEFDFVTEVDRTTERAIIDFILEKFPGHQILGEEGGDIGGTEPYQWIIDPLDGTTNYLHDVRAFSVSIAVMLNNEPVVGVIHDPMRPETFTAVKNGGAFYNGSRINVSSREILGHCLLSTGFPFRCKDQIDPYLDSFKRFFSQVRGVRRIGSAALDLAYVAAGRFDGFWELDLHKWDIAAGVLMILEAGGKVTGFRPEENYWETGNIVATNGFIHEYMLHELAASFPEYEVAEVE